MKSRTMTAELERELQKVEQELDDMAGRTKALAEELGVKYAVFRCGSRQSDNCSVNNDADIMSLSTMTDECIHAIYSLELRRKELINRLCR